MASRNRQPEVAKLLIVRGAKTNSGTGNGNGYWYRLCKPLGLMSYTATSYRAGITVTLLLDHNADIDARQRNQRTALDLAARNGYLEAQVAEPLIERGANVNIRNWQLRADSKTRRVGAWVWQVRRVTAGISRFKVQRSALSFVFHLSFNSSALLTCYCTPPSE